MKILTTIVAGMALSGAVPARIALAQSAAGWTRPTGADAGVVDDAMRSELLRARGLIWHAWFRNDTAALQRLLPQAAAAGQPEGWQNRDQILADARGFARSGAKLVGLRFADTRIARDGDVAVIFSTYTLEVERGGRKTTSGGRASEVFVRRNGVWTNPLWYLAAHPQSAINRGRPSAP